MSESYFSLSAEDKATLQKNTKMELNMLYKT